jgi:phosphoheptose isomerase
MNFPSKEDLLSSNFLKNYSSLISDGFNSIDNDQFEKIADLLNEAINNDNKLYCCGNGGSAAISEHFVCDFLKGSATDSSIQPIIHSLTSNIPTMTAVANDISYDEVFSFQLKRYAKEGDILICVSSSGNSQNILNVIEEAKMLNVKTVSFVGFSGGKAKDLADLSIHIDINNYGVVEDIHQSLMHMLSQYIRLKNLENGKEIEKLVF